MTGWNGWAALKGELSGGAPVVGRNADGRLEVFAEAPGTTGPELAHIWQDPASATGWSGWGSLGTPPAQFLGSPAVGSNADGRLEAFARVGLMSTGGLWHIWQTAPNNGWSTWDNLGGGIGAHFVRLIANADGPLEVFALSTVGHLEHIAQTAPSSGWGAWDDLGTPGGVSLFAAAVGSNADGRLEAFVLGSDGALWHIWQTAAGATWSAWASLGAPAGVNLAQPSVGLNADGRLEVFAIGNFATLWHMWQTAPNNGWSGWSSLGTPPGAAFLGQPIVARNADGRLEVFATETNGSLWHLWQTAPGAGWSGWDNLGGEPTNDIGVGQNADGRLEIFAEARAATGPHPLWHRWQVAPSGAWSVSEDWEQTLVGDPAQLLFTPAGGAILVRTQSGLFRSNDTGLTWTSVNLPAGPGRVAVDPTNPAIIYGGGTGALFKTTNGGATWSSILALPGDQVLGLAVSPADHNLIYAATGVANNSFDFRRSQDGGATWTTLEGPLGTNLCIWAVLILAPHPTDGQRVMRTSGCYAGRNVPFGDSLNQSVNRGATWAPLFHPTPLFPSRLAGGHGNQPARFYMAAYFGAPPGGGKVFRSDDDGVTWNQVLNFATGPAVSGLAYDPTQPDQVYAGLTTGSVQASHDGGTTWADLGSGGLGGVADLAVSLDGTYLLAATDLGVWRIAR